MAISPKQEEALAIEIRRIYEDAEMAVFESIKKRIMDGRDIADWEKRKLIELGDVLKDARKVQRRIDRLTLPMIKKITNLAYITGNKSALSDLREVLQSVSDGEIEMPESVQLQLFPDQDPADMKIDVDATIESLSGINIGAVEALAAATTEQLQGASLMIVRQTNDIYREVVTRIAGAPLTGADTRLEASQRILDEFAKRGITVFDGKRRWNIASYTEMATRSAVGQASVQGHIDQNNAMGFDLVMVSDHAEECHLCRPWEGKVLSQSGNDPRYPSLNAAKSGGLFHPNCGHRLQTYFEGYTTPLKKTADPKGSEQREHQRYLERTIRYWKRREALAGTDKAKRKAAMKREEWQKQMKTFTDETGRRRKYEREQITKAR